ncbi:MAG: CatB-related O-acetyltransferase [Nitrospira sp.]|nr:CatB-related O-acetyltransferase [Nitrospira sp.]
MSLWATCLAALGLRRRPSTLFMQHNPKYAAIVVGEGTYGRPNIPIPDDGSTVRIGRYCSIAGGVSILTSQEHHLTWVSTFPFQLIFGYDRGLPSPARSKGSVDIGHDVWIGTEALILSGVSVGHGAVIAARSVVTKNVPPYAIVAGVPARVIRYRFDDATIASLLRIAWWDWPREKIESALPLLMSDRLDAFITQHDVSPEEQSCP